jgi:hypothetical protein
MIKKTSRRTFVNVEIVPEVGNVARVELEPQGAFVILSALLCACFFFALMFSFFYNFLLISDNIIVTSDHVRRAR